MSDLKQSLYLIADEMRGMASVGQYFAGNIYEVERAHHIMELAAKIAVLADDEAPEIVREVFEAEPWLRFSPAIGVEAFVLNAHGEVLLIQRRDNERWALPGGLAEIGQTFTEAVLRELWEEAGLRGDVERLLGIFDGRLWGSRIKVHLVHLAFLVKCDDLVPKVGVECLDAQFFTRHQLPQNMHPGHDLRIPKCFEALESQPFFDPARSDLTDLPTFQRPDGEHGDTQ